MRTSQIALANFAFPAKIPFSFATRNLTIWQQRRQQKRYWKTDFFVSFVVACGNNRLSSRNVPSDGHEERGEMAAFACSRQNFIKFLLATRGNSDARKSLTRGDPAWLLGLLLTKQTNKQTIKNNLASGSNHSNPFCQAHLCVDRRRRVVVASATSCSKISKKLLQNSLKFPLSVRNF